jgi:hypothetical protein
MADGCPRHAAAMNVCPGHAAAASWFLTDGTADARGTAASTTSSRAGHALTGPRNAEGPGQENLTGTFSSRARGGS